MPCLLRIVGKGGILEAFGVGLVCCCLVTNDSGGWVVEVFRGVAKSVVYCMSLDSGAVVLGCVGISGTCTFLTTLSLSAIATNGKIAGGGAYYLLLGQEKCVIPRSVVQQLVAAMSKQA